MSEADNSQIEERIPEEESAPASDPDVIEPPRPERPRVLPLGAGGALAGLIGMAAAYVYLRETSTDYQALIEAQAAEIAALKEQIAALPTEQPDLTPISTELEEGGLLGFVVYADDPVRSQRTERTRLLFVPPERVLRILVDGATEERGGGFGF